MVTTHKMNLAAEPFAKVAEGTKQIELRLNDEKRQSVMIGNHIIFTSADDENSMVEVEVVGLLRYSSFSDLIDDFPAKVFGHDDKNLLKEAVYQYYTPEKEASNGVLGIRIRKIK